LALIGLIIVAAVAGAYYFESRSAANSPVGATTVDITIEGGVGVGTVDTYYPDNFTVKEGQVVTLAVLNTDDNTHGLAIDQFKVDTGIINSGNTARVTFVANQTGTFKYYEPAGYCKGGVGNVCNSQQDMIGYMTVGP
jgi:nitrous oxide reductase